MWPIRLAHNLMQGVCPFCGHYIELGKDKERDDANCRSGVNERCFTLDQNRKL
jgi:hypothetical protein